MSFSTELAALYSRDLQRAVQEIAAFPTDESIWQTAPGVSNSAGNLALHLEGNLLEFIGRQLGGVPYTRQRPLEFSTTGLSRAEVAARLESVRAVVVAACGALAETTLAETYPQNVLGQPLSTRQFLLHLLGHLNYHLGQMDYLRRITTGNGAIPLAGL